MNSAVMDNSVNHKEEIRRKTAKPLLVIGMVSIVMFFGGLTSAVIVEQGSGGWIGFEFPLPFWISTLLILLSSFTYAMVQKAVKADRLENAGLWMTATLILGLGFMATQVVGWRMLINQGLYLTGTGHQISASYFYVLTWAHFAHAIGGIISLIVVAVKLKKHIYNSKNLLGLQVSAIYWHFLGALWVYLFLFLNFINQNI